MPSPLSPSRRIEFHRAAATIGLLTDYVEALTRVAQRGQAEATFWRRKARNLEAAAAATSPTKPAATVHVNAHANVNADANVNAHANVHANENVHENEDVNANPTTLQDRQPKTPDLNPNATAEPTP